MTDEMSGEAIEYLSWVTADELARLPADMRRKALAWNAMACASNSLTAMAHGDVGASVRWCCASVSWAKALATDDGLSPTPPLPSAGETFTVEVGGPMKSAEEMAKEIAWRRRN